MAELRYGATSGLMYIPNIICISSDLKLPFACQLLYLVEQVIVLKSYGPNLDKIIKALTQQTQSHVLLSQLFIQFT
jgi:hypothetical protein